MVTMIGSWSMFSRGTVRRAYVTPASSSRCGCARVRWAGPFEHHQQQIVARKGVEQNTNRSIIINFDHHNNYWNLRRRRQYGSLTEPGPIFGIGNTNTKTNNNNNSISKEESESFKIAHINYDSGKLRQIYLPPTEILKRLLILPRDLVSMNLTTRQERYEENRLQEKRHRRPGERNSNSNNQNIFLRPPTAIVPRRDCLILTFGNVRAVATRDAIYILDSHSQIAKSFAKEVSKYFQKLSSLPPTSSSSSSSSPPSSNNISIPTTNSNQHDRDQETPPPPPLPVMDEPPELIFLELVLKDTVETYTRRIRIFEPIVSDLLDRVVGEVFSDQGVHQLAPLKDALRSFELQVQQSLKCLTDLLNDDEEMLHLLLTEQEIARTSGVPVAFDRHQHVELLLGVYARQLNNILQEISYLLARLQSKQEFVALALAGYRNRLVRMNVNVSIIGMSTGILTAATGMFGMNLVSGLEEAVGTFYIVAALSISTGILTGAACFQFMSGTRMHKEAAERLVEIETISNALSDMSALDYTVKKMLTSSPSPTEGGHGQGEYRMNKEEFRQRLTHARISQQVSDEEIDLLFNALDCHKDEYLTKDDFDDLTKVA